MSSAISAVFSGNICGSAWRTHCVFFCYLCCFLCEYLWRCMEDSLCLLLLSLLFSLGIFVAVHGGLTVSSSAISAVFSVNICGGAWRTHCVFFWVSIEKVCNRCERRKTLIWCVTDS